MHDERGCFTSASTAWETSEGCKNLRTCLATRLGDWRAATARVATHCSAVSFRSTKDPNSALKSAPMSVATKPGYTVDTSTPLHRTSAQSPDAKPVIAHFAAA